MQASAPGVTKEQQEIFDYEPYGMVITAPAGCGKTEALAYRAKGLLERYDFSGNGRRLLITSFTNQAKDNINERLKKYIGVQTLREHVTVCNFHGLASRIIKSHGQLIGIEVIGLLQMLTGWEESYVLADTDGMTATGLGRSYAMQN